MQTTTTVVTQTSQNLIDVKGLVSFGAGVAVSFLAALFVYSVRQYWEKQKLESALIEEVDKMKGIGDWKSQTTKISEPPGRQIQADDVPPPESIPTTVYEQSAGKLGLLQGPIDRICGTQQISSVVNFYSRVIRAKGIIRDISTEGEVSNTAQEELYDLAKPLQQYRDRITEERAFISINDEDFETNDEDS